MKKLERKEREFLESLLSLSPQKKNGYLVFCKYIKGKTKSFKRSRVLIQLDLNKKLEIWEQVHHKDKNRENDSIENLEVIDTKDFNYHSSHHHTGTRGRTNKEREKSNKLSNEMVKQIKELSSLKECQTSSGKVNYSEIGRRLNISGFTVYNYLKKKEDKNGK